MPSKEIRGYKKEQVYIYHVCHTLFICCSWSSLFVPMDSIYSLMSPFSHSLFPDFILCAVVRKYITYVCVRGLKIQLNTLKNSTDF